MRILVVDDSALMRRCIVEILEELPNCTLATARDGRDALEKVKSFSPDVITLDVNMPIMDGITCLSHIMEEYQIPVIMLSSITEKSAVATFEALELGAVDYVTKPDGTVSRSLYIVADELKRKVRTAARSKPQNQQRKNFENRLPPKTAPNMGKRKRFNTLNGLAVIAISTGGPGTIERVLSNLRDGLSIAIVIIQHMPESFTGHFAKRLNALCDLDVIEVNKAMKIEPNNVYLAKGGRDCTISKRKGSLIITPAPVDGRYSWHPSASRFLKSCLSYIPPEQILGVMMTGMGDDGCTEMKHIHDRDGFTIAQDISSAILPSMPKSLIDRKGATIITNPENIAKHIHRREKSLASIGGIHGLN